MPLDECARWLATSRKHREAAAVKSKRAAPGKVGKAGKAAGKVAGKRPALGEISVNGAAARGRDEKKRKSGGSNVSLPLTIQTPPPPSEPRLERRR